VLIGLAGLAMGATSLGGVLVAPVLHGLRGEPMASAIAASSFAFLLTGLLALGQSEGPILKRIKADAPLHLGALVGAATGAALSALTPDGWIRLWIGLIALGSGLHNLWSLHRTSERSDSKPPLMWPSSLELSGIGLVVGLGSALSGTGGPLLLLPWLLARSCPIDRSIASALVIQVPIAVAASSMHLMSDRLGVGLGLTVAVVLLPCAWVGRQIARHAPSTRLRQSVSALLIAAGLWMLLD